MGKEYEMNALHLLFMSRALIATLHGVHPMKNWDRTMNVIHR